MAVRTSVQAPAETLGLTWDNESNLISITYGTSEDSCAYRQSGRLETMDHSLYFYYDELGWLFEVIGGSGEHRSVRARSGCRSHFPQAQRWVR